MSMRSILIIILYIDYIIGSVRAAVFESTKEAVSHKYSGDATHYNEIDTSIDRDARAIAEKNKKLSAENSDGYYHGLGAYKTYRQGESATTNASGTLGPARAPSFLRAINRFDYQPAICKDYKETGYCGFGDSCIYMHDRGDYKSGWQLEKEWEAIQAKKKKKLEEAAARLESGDMTALTGEDPGNDDAVDDENLVILEETELPFACFICREDFKSPVVSTCGHYFCRDCAMNSYKTDPKCKACSKPTFGVFNRALKLEKKLAATAALKASAAEEKRSTANPAVILTSRQGSWEDVGS
jgi:RING finger protein 113A